ncbi:MAG: hypothetical protein PHN63_04375 [Candidatus Omnitrophica bacterium]|nr:hypothetical protein [Candidatus Omnitrophota bacterium]
MRYVCVAVAIVFMFGITAVAAEKVSADCGMCGVQKKDTGARSGESATAKEGADRGEPLSDEEEYGEDNRREMPQQQTYDENTGLPDNVPSDREGEI